MANESGRGAWLAAVFVLLAGCGPELDDETRILRTLDAMTEAVEQGDVGDFMTPVADDFVAVNGRLDRRALGLLVRRERLARDAVRVRRVDTQVELVGDSRAVASFRALATGGSGLLPDEGRFWRVETGWRRDGDDWALISAEWE
ncbi:MAG: hypothetical protein KGY48_01405 [Wenzhouxiangellaceae bacterium]|nr:hypothetical protein [Wenzhouxiangellaceae bacterium]MBS3746161.1 hypothetical protein [Wenzhouxiangellaceae bacterium]MBS3822627.1 hypothetical protein [Wenzhouxiangellaceae bacterium]